MISQVHELAIRKSHASRSAAEEAMRSLSETIAIFQNAEKEGEFDSGLIDESIVIIAELESKVHSADHVAAVWLASQAVEAREKLISEGVDAFWSELKLRVEELVSAKSALDQQIAGQGQTVGSIESKIERDIDSIKSKLDREIENIERVRDLCLTPPPPLGGMVMKHDMKWMNTTEFYNKYPHMKPHYDEDPAESIVRLQKANGYEHLPTKPSMERLIWPAVGLAIALNVLLSVLFHKGGLGVLTLTAVVSAIAVFVVVPSAFRAKTERVIASTNALAESRILQAREEANQMIATAKATFESETHQTESVGREQYAAYGAAVTRAIVRSRDLKDSLDELEAKLGIA